MIVSALAELGAAELSAGQAYGLAIHVAKHHCIRASVDALCRDGTVQISRERVQRGRLTRQGTRS